MIDLNELIQEFENRYGKGGPVRIFRAPGRVNLIGEHTDYNDGLVLPAALDRATYVAARGREDRQLCAASLNFDGAHEFDLDDEPDKQGASWARYVRGVAAILERDGAALNGADVLIGSDVPLGAGLSSSAALEVSIGLALTRLAGVEIDPMDLALTGQKAEHEFAGVRSGIMDQFSSVFGREGHALFLDCRSMEHSEVPVGDARFLLCNTKVKHDLADSEYNLRRDQCEAAAAFFGKDSLRDVTDEEFAARSDEMQDTEKRRARHVLTENRRVLDSVEALRSGRLDEFGSLMNASHESLRSDFEVSSPELDVMAAIARRQAGVLGARMTGGGFGGCVVVLIEKDANQGIAENIASLYQDETGVESEMYPVRIGNGAAEIERQQRSGF